MADGVQDYIDYIQQLEDTYMRSYGEVLTFGSGDCGQLAHGIDEDEDLMVKYPRIVYSLRYNQYDNVICNTLLLFRIIFAEIRRLLGLRAEACTTLSTRKRYGVVLVTGMDIA
jgi:hypothetical protein